MVMTINPVGVHTCTRVFSQTITVPYRPEGCLSEFRRDLVTWLGGHPCAHDAVTAAYELVSNAIRHGSAVDGRVTIRSYQLSAGRLTIDVTDSGRGDGEAPFITEPPAGFGLKIVEGLCASVHPHCTDSGWHVEVELAAQPTDIGTPRAGIRPSLRDAPPGGAPDDDMPEDGRDAG